MSSMDNVDFMGIVDSIYNDQNIFPGNRNRYLAAMRLKLKSGTGPCRCNRQLQPMPT